MGYREILRDQLIRDEELRPFVYLDAMGKTTVGVGRNLDDVGLRPDEISLMLENDMTEAERAARALIPSFDSLSDVRKAVCANMAFNLGQTRLAGFVGTLRAIAEERWADAAAGMLASRWATQVGARAHRLAYQMEHDRLET